MVKAPAVSVVIPMYNAEKYIVECLDSVLAQTLQNYEVILVNDCSTDGSRKIAESYLEKFDGRLAIYDNEKNSGPSATRNNGLKISRGEYVFFLDADDLIVPEGLRRMYGVAKRFEADMVNCTGFYNMSDDGQERTIRHLKKPTATDENIFEMNLEWRVKGLLKENFYWTPWRKLLRRKFLTDNELFFPEKIIIHEDQIWTVGLLLCAKKIIHTPLAVYLYRKSTNSLCRQKRTTLQSINVEINSIVQGQTWLSKVMDKIPFFEAHPEYRYALLEHSARRYFDRLFDNSLKVSSLEMYGSIKEEFGKNFGEYDVLISALFTLVNKYQRIIAEDKKRLSALEKPLT